MNIEIDNININYIKEGNSGSCVLLLHGWGSNIELFNGIIKELSKEHIVYALDMPGFGKSEEIKEPWNVDNYVDFVMKFVQNMKIEKVSILGHSFGGRVIIKMSNRKNLPFCIDKLILVDSAGIKPKKVQKKTVKGEIYKILKKITGSKIVKKVFPEALNNVKSKFGSADYRSATPIMRETLVKVVNEDLEPLLKTIKYPTLLIWGEFDTATPLTDGKTMEKLIPDAGLVEIKGGTHYSFLEQPILVNRVLDSFLKDKEVKDE